LANLVARTASNAALFDSGVEEVLERFVVSFGSEIHLSVEQAGYNTDARFVRLWGYDTPEVWHASDARDYDNDVLEDYPDDVFEEFLEELGRHLLPGGTFIVQCVGGEKCRFPLVAYQWEVTKNIGGGANVKFTAFDCKMA